MAVDNEKIKAVIANRRKLHIEDDSAIESAWDELFAALGDDEEEIKKYLSSCNPYYLEWFSEIFEEIYGKFMNESMWVFLENLKNRMPKVSAYRHIQELAHFYEIEKKNDVPHPKVNELWDLIMGELVTYSEYDVIELINHCSESEIEAISPMFDDLLRQNYSVQVFQTVRNLKSKFKSPTINENIDIAFDEIRWLPFEPSVLMGI